MKVKCIESATDWFKAGNIYHVEGSKLIDTDGYGWGFFGIDAWNRSAWNGQPCRIAKFEEVKEMEFTKKDLRTGMKVKTRNGNKFLVIKDIDTCGGFRDLFFADFSQGYVLGESYSKDLKHAVSEDYDIVEVYNRSADGVLLNASYGFEPSYLEWERPEEILEMTMADVEKMAGKKVKIIGEDK